jgi:hypothetical protein
VTAIGPRSDSPSEYQETHRPCRSGVNCHPTASIRSEDPWASELAEWHLQTQSTPHDPGVIAAYRQLEEQTDGLFRSLTDRASPDPITVTFTSLRQPYDSDQEMISAIVNERRLEVSVAAVDRHRLHPVLDCRPRGPYDRFRAVHDIVGHGFGQRGFDAEGEYSAWRVQNCQYSGLARLALATELRAEYAVLRKTGEFAEHKALIIPSAVSRRHWAERVEQ